MKKLLSLAAILFAAHSAFGAIAFEQAPTACDVASAATTLTCTYATAVAAGSTLVAFTAPANSSGSAYTVSVSDSVNGAWTKGVECFGAGTQGDFFYYPSSAAGTPVVTVTYGTSTSHINLSIAAYTGVNTSTPFDAGPTCGTAFAGATGTGPTLTTTHAGDWLLHGLTYDGNTCGSTVSSPYTLRVSGFNAIADDAPGTTGSQTGPTFTLTCHGDPAYVIGAALQPPSTPTQINPFWFAIP